MTFGLLKQMLPTDPMPIFVAKFIPELVFKHFSSDVMPGVRKIFVRTKS